MSSRRVVEEVLAVFVADGVDTGLVRRSGGDRGWGSRMHPGPGGHWSRLMQSSPELGSAASLAPGSQRPPRQLQQRLFIDADESGADPIRLDSPVANPPPHRLVADLKCVGGLLDRRSGREFLNIDRIDRNGHEGKNYPWEKTLQANNFSGVSQ